MKRHIWVIEFLKDKKWTIVADYPIQTKKEAKDILRAWRTHSPNWEYRITKYKAK